MGSNSRQCMVRQRRYGIHGVDHMETGRFYNDPVPSFEELFRRYAETVHGIDENIGRRLRGEERRFSFKGGAS